MCIRDSSAIVHAGYDAKEGSLMAKYNVLGNAMYEKLCDCLLYTSRCV